MIIKISCGIIPIYINEEGKREFLIVQSHGGHWSFPKGHIEKQETFLETAKRELLEETGLVCNHINKKKIFTEKYIIKRKGSNYIDKTVHFFIGYTNNKNVVVQEKEIKDFSWDNEKVVAEKLTFEGNKKEVFNEVVEFLKIQ